MNIRWINRIAGGQDGAIWGNYLFRFQANGTCFVYELDRLKESAPDALAPEFARFQLPETPVPIPHSNAVMFGTEYYEPTDPFPLLYSNMYNNCAKQADPMKGVCCVYRLQQAGHIFSAVPVQLISIGFTEDPQFWCSAVDRPDVRPYGNFAIDRDKGLYYAFTMRDAANATRYFSFRLPKLREGVPDPRFGIRRVELSTEDLISYFDCPYHRFIQGACFHKGRLYSLEGFTDSAENPPALRIISPESQSQLQLTYFGEFGTTIEPEWIDFSEDTCYYSDNHGNLYIIDF